MEQSGNNPAELRPHLEDPELINSSIEAMRAKLWEERMLRQVFDKTLDDYGNLLQEFREAESQGKPFPSEQEERMYRIVGVLLDLQHLHNEREPEE